MKISMLVKNIKNM